MARFAAELAFELDPFQRRACAALESGHGVLVCAPTGAGKTIVGEFAVHLALASGGKCFYTTPIKALSNQKHNDFVARYGKEQIGLLTGDMSVNADAPVVVMTTEVLRNMLYADSPALRGLSYVVMDEVHFLADRMRGAVWEEVILHLPDDVRLVSLSATVSNAEEFGGWIQTVRGDTSVVVDDHRPVPLWQHMLVGKRLFDLFDYTADGARAPQIGGMRSSTQTCCATSPIAVKPIGYPTGAVPATEAAGRTGLPDRSGFYRPPSRPDVISMLDADGLLPAITFVFSRVGCDAAVSQCLRSSLRLTTEEERAQIAEVIDHRCGDLEDSDLAVLGYYEWREALLRGIAAAPRRPAAGIPAHRRGVVHRRADPGRLRHRDTGIGHQHAGPHRGVGAAGEVQRRTAPPADARRVHPADRPGRPARHRRRGPRRGALAARRGDHRTGTRSPGLASTRTFPLRSSFAPSYNMTINLVNRVGTEQAHRLLEKSFAQYQADRSVVSLVRGVERGQQMLDEVAAELGGNDAPILEYARLREQISQRERAQARASRLQRRQAVNDALSALRRGDIITITHGRRGGLAVVLEPARDSTDPRPLVLTENRWAGRISSADYSGESAPVGSMTLPKRVEHRQPRVRRDLASALRSAAAGLSAPGGRRGKRTESRDADPELAALREKMRRHPAHRESDRETQTRVAERYLRIERENAALQKKVAAATNSLARTFDRIVGLLTERGFIALDRRQSHGDRRRPAAGPDLQRERPAGRRMPAHRRLDRTAGCRVGRPCFRRCSTRRAAATDPGRRETSRSRRRGCGRR